MGDWLGRANTLVKNGNVCGTRTWAEANNTAVAKPWLHGHPSAGSGDACTMMGLIYMNARYYVPSLGRFASADTLVPNSMNPQQFNRFSYVLNNPLKLIDPSGHCVLGYADASKTDCNLTPVRPDSHMKKVINFIQKSFVAPFAGEQRLTSSFGDDHPTGIDWGGEITALAPANGSVTFADSDGTVGIWRIQNTETNEIREWSPFDTATDDNLLITDRDDNLLVEPQRLLATGEWIDLEPNWSHLPGTMLIIDHGNGIETVYYHLIIDQSIVAGVQVQQGDVLGVTANIGWSTGTHLHDGMRYTAPSGSQKWLNPIKAILKS